MAYQLGDSMKVVRKAVWNKQKEKEKNPRVCIKHAKLWALIISLFFCLSSFPSNFSSTNIQVEFAILGKVSAQSWENVSAGLPTTSTYYGVCFGNVNNDNNLDIAFAAGGVHVYLGDGTGSWTKASTGLPTGGTYYGVWLGDINNDSYDDLVVGSLEGIRCYISDGGGSWTNASTGLPMTDQYHGVCFGDIDGDTNLDILATNASGGIKAWTGNGAGSWTEASTGLPTNFGHNGIHCGDMNDDGNLDLVAAGFGGVRCYTGDGNGSWTNASVGLPTTSEGWMGVYCGDINNDGYDDVAATIHGGSNPIKVWTSNGAGSWTDASTGLPSGEFLDVISVWLGDINLDGNLDVVFPLTGSGLRVYAGSGTGVWTDITSSDLPLSGDPVGVCLGDINNDGILDIGCTWVGNGVRVYLTWNVTASYTFNLQEGWNFITMPLNNTTYKRAEDLAQGIPNCTHIAEWNTTTSSFEHHEKGTDKNNFTIKHGVGYLVYINASSNFEITGTIISSVEMSLTAGWNSIGRFNQTEINASDLASQITNCTAVAYWNDTLGRFITHPVSTNISNFVIRKGMGCMIYVASDEIWVNK